MGARISPGRPTILTRFWAKVDDSGGPDACWLWRGAKTAAHDRRSAFYGVFCVLDVARHTHRRQQAFVRAHRFALVLATGIEPEDLQACHDDRRCTSTLCCNPGHLRWGTDAENRLDWARKYGYGSLENAIAAAVDQLVDEGIIES